MIVIIHAGMSPGPTVATALAKAGKHVVAIDSQTDALAKMTVTQSDRIEPLLMTEGKVDKLALLQDAWRDKPVELVINLTPLAHPRDISGQMSALSMILRTTLKGLVKGRGTLVNVVAQPKDALALQAHGLCGAVEQAGLSLGAELHCKSVRVHTLKVPQDAPETASATLQYLATKAARHMQSAALELQ